LLLIIFLAEPVISTYMVYWVSGHILDYVSHMSHDIPGNYLWNLLKHDYSYAYVWLLILQIIPEGFHKKKSHDYCVISMKQIISMVIVLFPQKKSQIIPEGLHKKSQCIPWCYFHQVRPCFFQSAPQIMPQSGDTKRLSWPIPRQKKEATVKKI
jgi:hypothetical protein